MTRTRTKAACDESVDAELNDQRWYEPERAAQHLASLSDEQRAKLRKDWKHGQA